MAKTLSQPTQGGSYARDPKTGALTRTAWTEMPDQAAERLAEADLALETPAPAPEAPKDVK